MSNPAPDLTPLFYVHFFNTHFLVSEMVMAALCSLPECPERGQLAQEVTSLAVLTGDAFLIAGIN